MTAISIELPVDLLVAFKQFQFNVLAQVGTAYCFEGPLFLNWNSLENVPWQSINKQTKANSLEKYCSKKYVDQCNIYKTIGVSELGLQNNGMAAFVQGETSDVSCMS